MTLGEELLKYINTISFEITRRCNLSCKWCSKGEPQNLDISKEIIDKTLEELQDYYINCIRVTGGEPFLKPEIIEYLINKIIEKKIKVKMLHIISNATIKNEKIKNSIVKFISYGNDIQDIRKSIKTHFSERLSDTIYERFKNKDIMVAMVLSTYEHNNDKMFDEVYCFYDIIKSDNFALVSQNEINKGTVLIEGMAEKTYNDFSKEDLKYVRVLHNKFCIIDDSDKKELCIKKCVSIGASGKVYVGGMLSYEHIDTDYIFNIMDCKNDFWDQIDKWCWENPIYIGANSLVEIYKSLHWQKDNGYKYDPVIDAVDKIKMQIDIYEELLKYYHNELPHLNHCELNLFVVAVFLIKAYSEGQTLKQLRPFIEYTTGLSDSVINAMTKEKCKNIYDNLSNENNKRAVETIKNPFFKTIAKFIYVK